MAAQANPSLFLRQLFECAVATADPMRIISAHLPAKPTGRVIIIGAGKASARMAEAVEAVWGPCEGLVITRYGYGRDCRGIEIVEAAHPVPDEAGFLATKRVLDLVSSLSASDTVVALISGGASALLVAPAASVTLQEKQAVNAALLASGAPIGEMNIVRKHLSRVKGGQLAAAIYPAKLLALMISDVPGDDPALIGSGPTVADASMPGHARAILDKWNIAVPQSVTSTLNDPSRVIAPHDPRLVHTENRVIAAPSQSLEAAANLARQQRYDVRILGDRIEGEAREVARAQAAMALDIQRSMSKGASPVLLISGGELTVTRRGNGVGGPNAEFMLAMAIALNGATGIYALSCDTDGVDGAAEVAGAEIGPNTIVDAQELSLDALDYLARNDSHTFFHQINAQIITGPTLTNVNDFRVVSVEPI